VNAAGLHAGIGANTIPATAAGNGGYLTMRSVKKLCRWDIDAVRKVCSQHVIWAKIRAELAGSVQRLFAP